MQREQLLDVRGMMGHDYEFRLTAKGVQAAEAAFRKSQYAGAAPVPLANYCRAVREQAFRPQVTKDMLIESLGDLVMTEQTILDLGAAIMTGGARFMYGPTGNGKSSIAERLHRIFHDLVYIPYAVEVSGQTLSLFDPHVHHAAEPQPPGIDPRWVLCRRPFDQPAQRPLHFASCRAGNRGLAGSTQRGAQRRTCGDHHRCGRNRRASAVVRGLKRERTGSAARGIGRGVCRDNQGGRSRCGLCDAMNGIACIGEGEAGSRTEEHHGWFTSIDSNEVR